MPQKIKGYHYTPSEVERANEMSFREFFATLYGNDFMDSKEVTSSEKLDIICDVVEMYVNMKLINAPKPKIIKIK